MDTVAPRGIPRQVHIVPLGFEIDRAVIPFDDPGANHVHLLTIVSRGSYDREMFERQEEFTRKVEEALVEKQIPVDVWDVDLFNMHDVLRYVSGLIALEKRQRNLVYVNASAAGRFTSIGSAMAGMAHDVDVYYVEADGYAASEEDLAEHGQSICWRSEPRQEPRVLDPLRFELPRDPAPKLLADLAMAKRGWMGTEELAAFMKEHRVGVFRDAPNKNCSNQQVVTSLNKTMLDQLENKYKYITRVQVGRQRRIALTSAGMNIACISGHLPISGPVRSSGSRPPSSPGSP